MSGGSTGVLDGDFLFWVFLLNFRSARSLRELHSSRRLVGLCRLLLFYCFSREVSYFAIPTHPRVLDYPRADFKKTNMSHFTVWHCRPQEKLLFRGPKLTSDFSLVRQALSCRLWMFCEQSSQATAIASQLVTSWLVYRQKRDLQPLQDCPDSTDLFSRCTRL